MKHTCRPRLLFQALLLLGLTGCGGTPGRFLSPVDAPPNLPQVSMVVATTRDPSEDKAQLFTGDRGPELAYSRITVSIPENREPGSVQWPRTTPGDPNESFAVTSATPIDRSGVSNWLRMKSGKARRVFVYVHGYNTPFGNAVFRFAQLIHDADAEVAPVLFSWPSRGRLTDYKRDLDNATYSRSDLADLLRYLARQQNVSEIVVFAHSMGAWVAVEAVRQLALEPAGVPPKLRNLVLASPDIDVGVFRRQVTDMGPRRPDLTLFVSQQDRALQLSSFIARGGTRLGAIDTTADQYRSMFKELQRVTIIDLTALNQGDRINHSLYAASPEVVRAIGNRLVSGQQLNGGGDTSGLGVVETLSSATRLIIATPVLLLDATTEANN